MALHKRNPAPKMPFPGESPTVSLAVAAGQMYGLNGADEAPPKAASPKSARKKAATKTARKPPATRKTQSKSK